MVRVLVRVLVMLVVLLLLGCVAPEDDDRAASGRSDSAADREAPAAGGDGGAPGAPIDNGGGEAPGAPIDIPAITIAENQPLDAVRAQLEEKLRDVCGGQVCLTIEVAETDENHETCQYSGSTDPPAGTSVESGGKVTLVMGSRPCTDANGDGVTDDNDGDGVADDLDGDGTPDVLDDDVDGDGIPDAEQSPS